jgi:hypothetical protein
MQARNVAIFQLRSIAEESYALDATKKWIQAAMGKLGGPPLSPIIWSLLPMLPVVGIAWEETEPASKKPALGHRRSSSIGRHFHKISQRTILCGSGVVT